jgi:hypothetical protein
MYDIIKVVSIFVPPKTFFKQAGKFLIYITKSMIFFKEKKFGTPNAN